MKTYFFKAFYAILLLGAFASTPAFAAESLEPLNEKITYQIRWNGIGIGRVILEIEETKTRYQISVDTKTRGIVDIFAPLRSFIRTNGRVTAEGEYGPALYTARAQSSGGDRLVELHYKRDGSLKERIREPLDDPDWRPEVPLAELVGITDPLTGFLRFRKEFYSNLKAKKEETTMMLYDGRRLAELRVKAINPTRRKIDGEYVPVVNSVIFRSPVNGYTPKELAKWEEGDPTVHLYFSEDMTLMPVEMTISLGFGMISATRETPDKD